MPYRGSLPALNDVIAGHVQMMFCDLGPATGALQAGTVRPLGMSSTFRVPGFENIPPLAENGVPGFDAVGWQMLVAPAKTPRPIVDQLNREMTAILAEPDTKEQILQVRVHSGRQPRGRRAAGLRQIRDGALGQGGARRRHRRLAMMA